MKTQSIIKILIVDDYGRAAIYSKDYKFYQVQKLDVKLLDLMGIKKERFFYAYINNRGELKIEQEVIPQNW